MKKAVVSARQIALEILYKIDVKKKYPHPLLEKAFCSNKFSSLDKRLINELVNGVLRWCNKIDWIIEQFSSRRLNRINPYVKNILRLGVYQLLFLDKIPPFAAINESVNLAYLFKCEKSKGFINGLLRTVDRQRDNITFPDFCKEAVKHISIVYAHPEWMINRWINRLGVKETIKLCQSNNQLPPWTIRTNTLKIGREDLVNNLKDEVDFLERSQVASEGLKISGFPSLSELNCYRKGWFQVQDEAAQLVSYIVDPQPGEMILDSCAAPGGKTTHLAQLMNNQGEIIAFDIDKDRLFLVKENCQRLGISIVKTHVGDITKSKYLDKYKFDRILVDAPCSGIGVIRRHPDIKWRKRENSFLELAERQLYILNAVTKLLKPGGLLIYSTCTTEPEENQKIVEKFLMSNNNFCIERADYFLPEGGRNLVDKEGFMQTFPHLHQMDGAFVARLKSR